MIKILLFLSLAITGDMSSTTVKHLSKALKTINDSSITVDTFSNAFEAQRRTIRRRTIRRTSPKRTSSGKNTNNRGFLSGLFAGSVVGSLLGGLFGGGMYGGGSGGLMSIFLIGGLIYFFIINRKSRNNDSQYNNHQDRYSDYHENEYSDEEVIEEIIEEVYEDGVLVETRKITKDADNNVIESTIADKKDSK